MLHVLTTGKLHLARLYTKLKLPVQHLTLERNNEHVFQSQENEVGEKTGLAAASTAILYTTLLHTGDFYDRWMVSAYHFGNISQFRSIHLPP